MDNKNKETGSEPKNLQNANPASERGQAPEKTNAQGAAPQQVDNGNKAKGKANATSSNRQNAGQQAPARPLTHEEKEKAEKAKRRKIRQAKRLSLIMAMLILVAVVAGLAVWGLLHLKPADVTVQGQADCDVVRVSGKLAGRVAEIYVKEGDYVYKGQRLAKIYSSTAKATLSKAKEMKNVAASQNKKVERGTREELIKTAQNMVDQAKAAEEITRKTFERLDNLFKEGVVSEQKRDEAKAALDAATAAVATAMSQLELAKNGPQEEDKEASRGMENVAEA